MDMGVLQGIGTLLLMLAFIGLCVWAYSPRQRRRFEEDALLPFRADDDESQSPADDGVHRHE